MRILFTLSLVIFSINFANANMKIINQYDLITYHPEEHGLKDLVYEARIEGLTERLNKAKSYGALQDVHFKIYWMFPGQYEIEVVEPKVGFKELKRSLKNQIKQYLDFLIPIKLSNTLRSYDLTSKKSGKDILIVAKDRTKVKPISELQFTFDKNSKIKRMFHRVPGGSNTIDFSFSRHGWSNNKWSIDEIKTTRVVGHMTYIETKSFEYEKVITFGFPKKITIESYQKGKFMNKDKKIEEKESPKATYSIMFSKFEVNKGKGKRFIINKLRR